MIWWLHFWEDSIKLNIRTMHLAKMWHETQIHWVSWLLLGISAWSPVLPDSNFSLFDPKSLNTLWILKASSYFPDSASHPPFSTYTQSPFFLRSFPFHLIRVLGKCVVLLAFNFTWYRGSICLYMEAEKGALKYSISVFPEEKEIPWQHVVFAAFSHLNIEFKNTSIYLVSLSVSLCGTRLH